MDEETSYCKYQYMHAYEIGTRIKTSLHEPKHNLKLNTREVVLGKPFKSLICIFDLNTLADRKPVK